MRMRTKITHPSVLMKLGHTLERLHKQWIFHLTPDRLHFTVSKADFQTGVQVWAQLSTDTLFEDYRIESASDNHIWLEVNGDHLLRALKSGSKSVQMIMRLSKKEGLPVLSFTITNQSRTGKLVILVQDVPVRVISPEKTEEFREPVAPEPDVHILMPPILTLRTIAERMKSISQRLILSANMGGQLTMSVSNDIVKVQTFFNDLINPQLDPTQVDVATHPSTGRSRTEFAEAEVDIRDFIKFVQCYQLHPSKILCCINERHCLIFYVVVGDDDDGDKLDDRFGSLTYRIPLRAR
ncbi:Checkpoint protein hus1 [Polyrhizophydium stewartii]|uniref:Checkpoint protein n=1 Tax=Polyrhizophydium stewartii TaxID=2732419 RepID=A0ABR4MZQ7_9FUNG